MLEESRAVWQQRPELRSVWQQRPTIDDIRSQLRTHRVLVTALAVVAVFVAADSPVTAIVTERAPGPHSAIRVPTAYPVQVALSTPSVVRYLDAIENGENLREQAVVAAAARATLERAKAEAAAVTAGEWQEWISGDAVRPPGFALPGIGGFVLPALGIFTSGFGSRWGAFHQGVDIAGPIGTPIYAIADGTVIEAGPANGFGLWVRIRHDDGSISIYGHLYDFFVSVGERVPAGMQIARMGNRGDSTGPHLHFEVVVDGRHVDPQAWLAVRGLKLT